MASIEDFLSIQPIFDGGGDTESKRQAADATLKSGSLSGILKTILIESSEGDRGPIDLLRLLRSVAMHAPPSLQVHDAVRVILVLVQLSVANNLKSHIDFIIEVIAEWMKALLSLNVHVASLFLLDMNELLDDLRALWISLQNVSC